MNFLKMAGFKFLLVLVPFMTFFVPKISGIVNSYLLENRYFKNKTKLTSSEPQNDSGETEDYGKSDSSDLEDKNEDKEEEKQKSFFDLLSDEALKLVGFIPDKETQKLSDFLDEQYQILSKLNLGENKLTALADIIILSKLSDLGLFNVAATDMVEKSISSSLQILNSDQKFGYSQEDYEQMKARSEKFANSGKKSAPCLLDNVVFINNSDAVLTEPPVSYDKQVLISIEDFKRIADAEIEYMENNATIIAKTQAKILEIEIGNQEVYVNDIKNILPAPILNVDGMAYLPCASIMSLLGINVVNIPATPAVIFY